MNKYLICTALAVPLLFGTAASAQTATTPSAAPPDVAATPPITPATQASPPVSAPAEAATLSAADKAFVAKAAQGGVAEVQMAQLAQQKADNADVKQFAQTMIDEHTPNNEQLAKLAAAKGVEPPSSPDAHEQAMLTKLQGLSGAKFDKAYIKGQVKAHTAMLKLFKDEARKTKDADLKSFSEQTTTAVEHHLTMAKGLEKSGA